jgi:hypothetical protein
LLLQLPPAAAGGAAAAEGAPLLLLPVLLVAVPLLLLLSPEELCPASRQRHVQGYRHMSITSDTATLPDYQLGFPETRLLQENFLCTINSTHC